MKTILIFLFFTVKALASETAMKTCLAAEFLKFKECPDLSVPACKDAEKKYINTNCDKINRTKYNLDENKGAIFVAKSENGSEIWILETITKTMIKIQ